jgi:hypothetical protein
MRPKAHEALEHLKTGFVAEERRLQQAQVRDWHVDPDTAMEAKKDWKKDEFFRLVDASPSDIAKVVRYYQHCPAVGFDVGSVRAVISPSRDESFRVRLQELQEWMLLMPYWQRELWPWRLPLSTSTFSM